MRVTAIGLGLLLALSGCASSMHAGEQPTPQTYEQVESYAQEIDALVLALHAASAAGGDACADACARQTAICELAEKICTISARHPGDARLSGHCDDGRTRCESAREAVAGRCECGEP